MGEWPTTFFGFRNLSYEGTCTVLFFPFDLSNESHSKYLSKVIEERTISICLVADSKQTVRVHQLSARRCISMAGLLSKVTAELNAYPAGMYKFDGAVSEFEQNLRLVDHFQYCVRDGELQTLITSLRETAAKATAEDRARASQSASELLNVWSQHYHTFVQKIVYKIPSSLLGLRLFLDLYGEFASDYDGFGQLVTDAIAARPHKPGELHLETVTLLSASIFKLISDVIRFQESDEISTDQLETDFRDFLSRISEGRGFSVKSLANLLSSVGVAPRGLPGRTPKDYSSEYLLKRTKSWRAVAAWTLENDPETRQEFGGREYDLLTYEEKERLERRIREGVRSYAKRKGKVHPVPRHITKPLPGD
jgi:hypothetical protein